MRTITLTLTIPVSDANYPIVELVAKSAGWDGTGSSDDFACGILSSLCLAVPRNSIEYALRQQYGLSGQLQVDAALADFDASAKSSAAITQS